MMAVQAAQVYKCCSVSSANVYVKSKAICLHTFATDKAEMKNNIDFIQRAM